MKKDLQRCASPQAQSDVELDSTAWAFASGFFTEGRYFHYLLNPSEMDSDLQTIQTYAMGTAVVAGTLAGGLQLAAYYGLTQVGTVGLTQIPAQLSLEWGLWTGTGATSAAAARADKLKELQASLAQAQKDLSWNLTNGEHASQLGPQFEAHFAERIAQLRIEIGQLQYMIDHIDEFFQ